MTIPKWRNLSNFPVSSGDWSSYYPLLFWKQKGESKVRYHLNKAKLILPILVSSPDTANRYVPPILLDPKSIRYRQLREAKHIYYIALIFLIIGSLLMLWLMNWHFTSIFSILIIMLVGQSRFNLKLFSMDSSRFMHERWYFYGWSTATGPYYGYNFLFFMITLGLVQMNGASVLDGNENYLLAYGLAYERVSIHHEWWRVISATLLHIDLAHWLVNTLLGSTFFFMYGATLRLRVIPVALVSACLSFLAVYTYQLYFDLDSEGIIGFSGGIAGVVGYFFAANLRFPLAFPKQLWITTLFAANMSFLAISIAMSLTSFIAHLSGFLVGILLGYLSMPIDARFFTKDTQKHNHSDKNV